MIDLLGLVLALSIARGPAAAVPLAAAPGTAAPVAPAPAADEGGGSITPPPKKSDDEKQKTEPERTPPAPGSETMPRGPKPGEIPKPTTPIEKEPGLPVPIELTPNWSLVPMPIIFSDPNNGVGGGLMGVFLYNPGKRIELIEAPSFDYTTLLSVSVTNRLFWYPTKQEELFIYNDYSPVRGNTDNEIRFHGRDRGWDYTDFIARTYFFIDGRRRFFGFGPSTKEDDESDYEQREFGVEGDLGYRFWDVLRFAVTARYRRTSTRAGLVDRIDDTTEKYADVEGVGEREVDALALGLRLTLDLRDSAATPTEGVFLDLFGEAAPRGMISEFGFWRWVVDARWLLPIYEDKWIHVMRGTWHGIAPDGDTPFWELPTLGGASNLRGYGVGRFTDENYLLFTVEERLRIWEKEISNNKLILELAGFADLGRVYGRLGAGLTDHDWNFVPGAGARMLLPDSAIVARLDVGFGSEGMAIFIVLGYAF